MKSGNRQSVRLSGHDYSGPGIYFVTLCTEGCERLFGQVINGEMRLDYFGLVVQDEWMRSPQIRSEVDLDRWIVMPDHFHGIVFILPKNGFRGVVGAAGGRPALQSRSLGALIGGFKSITTKRINKIRGTAEGQVWQRNYDEHIIDSDEELQRVRQYIKDNPKNWKG